jgi:multidrug resistance efflux pump
MERTDAGLPTHRALTAEAVPGPADGAPWRRFAEAETPETYCGSWLTLMCGTIHGVLGGIVLVASADGVSFSPIAVWPGARRDMRPLATVAERALRDRRGVVLPHDGGNGDGSAPPGGHDIAYPIEIEGGVRGVVVLELAPRGASDLQTAMRQLHWGSAWLEVLFRRERAAQDDAAKKRLLTVLETAAVPGDHERFRAAATAFVTAVASALACDRVSLGFTRGHRVRVRALSHSATFQKRANLVRAIEGAMEEALDQGVTLVYPDDAGRAAQVTRVHADLAREHGAGGICSVPLGSHGQIYAVLTLERPPGASFDTATVEVCETIGAVAGPLLELRRRDDRWLVAKAAESCRRTLAHLIGPGHLAMKLGTAAAVAASVFLALATADYRVSANTVLEAAVRRAAVAPFNGYVVEAPTRAGDLVRTGQLLCRLDERDIRLERMKWIGQQDQLVKQYHQAMAMRSAAQVGILTAQIDQARAQVELLDDQLARTHVRAPFDGIVVNGDLSQSLGSPVERGQVLFEVAPLDAYRVILQVDERDVADVRPGQRGELVLAGFPSDRMSITLDTVTPVSTARDGRNHFRVEARLQATLDKLRPGMEGVAKIEIDHRRLVWIWTHQVLDWVRLGLWSWLP